MKKNVIVYSANWCPYCFDLKDYLRERKIKYDERDIDLSAKWRAQWLEKSTQQVVPLLDIDGHIYEGFSRKSLDKFIKNCYTDG
ncbi:MAG: NrdH-redoxin [Candidatus Nomurabacteria bacterium]|jgi:glutaredoxin|nr:NrdH-redoxin [Candidatus Nomurabacteria bacterium]